MLDTACSLEKVRLTLQNSGDVVVIVVVVVVAVFFIRIDYATLRVDYDGRRENVVVRHDFSCSRAKQARREATIDTCYVR